ncbi:MAG: FAD-dependent oxidoreductase [Nanoarchaeota archaeon]|nr:FAD-dependent oxidoreductase [Nanoarchaeota archaeon]
MENYDVVIVGGGIAGTGLAYNLSQICPKKDILVIDKNNEGGNAGYGYRNVFKNVIEKYDLPVYHKYKGVKVGSNDEVYFHLDVPQYFIDYKEVCRKFIERSSVLFKIEEGLSIKNGVLVTNKAEYKFKHLVDCSGSNLFLKRLHNHNLPYRYWVGKTRVIKNNKQFKTDYYYFFFGEDGYLEELYPLKDKLLHGDWQFSKQINYKKIKFSKKRFYHKIRDPIIEKYDFLSIPLGPTFPFVYRNYAILGDSCGMAPPPSALAIDHILENSSVLAQAIKMNNLKIYEKNWKKKYLEFYIKTLSSKIDRYHSSEIIKILKRYPKQTLIMNSLKKYPNIFLSMMKNIEHSDKKEIKKILSMYPKYHIIWAVYHYLNLKFKYLFMDLKSIVNI